MTFQALPGFRDFPPEELAFRSHILAVWRRVAMRYGFSEYDGPPLEPLELYTTKSGEEIVGQLFDFTDKGDRHVTLRPEMTPTFARMVSLHAKTAPKPIRWFAMPQLFRYEKQQRGRLREHFQLNCDLVGEAGPLADVEVIALAIDVCRELGLTADDFMVRLSDRTVIHTLLIQAGLSTDRFADALMVMDKLERAGKAASIARLSELGLGAHAESILRVAAIRSPEDLATLARELGLESSSFTFQQVLHGLDAMGLSEFIAVDFSIVRGLAYYTGTVFELFDRKGTFRAICGGGRYDTLLESLGGVSLPAVGFGMGDVVLGELLKDRGLKPSAPASIDCYLAAFDAGDLPTILRLAHQLRGAGVAAEYALAPANIGKQLKTADARGAKVAIVVGPDDRARGEVQLKDLRTKQQEAVPLDQVVARCQALLTSTG
jgi:histidyl-tRNA synthetase